MPWAAVDCGGLLDVDGEMLKTTQRSPKSCSCYIHTRLPAHLVRLWLETRRYWVRISVQLNVLSCAYTLLQIVQRPGVCSAVYGTVHYKEPLKSLKIPSFLCK